MTLSFFLAVSRTRTPLTADALATNSFSTLSTSIFNSFKFVLFAPTLSKCGWAFFISRVQLTRTWRLASVVYGLAGGTGWVDFNLFAGISYDFHVTHSNRVLDDVPTTAPSFPITNTRYGVTRSCKTTSLDSGGGKVNLFFSSFKRFPSRRQAQKSWKYVDCHVNYLSR